MGEKALSWQQVICVILVISALMFAGLGFAANIDPPTRRIGYTGLVCSLLLFGWMLRWHLRENARPDLVPDVLATLVQPGAIFELGNAAHFVINTGQLGGTLRFDALIQNNRDGETEFSLRFKPTIAELNVPAIECTIANAGLIHATLSIPLHPSLSQPKPLKARLFLSGNARGKGNRVRFARRLGVTRRVNPGMTAALLVAGHIHAGGGTILPIEIVPFVPVPSDSDQTASDWSYNVLWSPDAPATAEQMIAEIEQGPPLAPDAQPTS